MVAAIPLEDRIIWLSGRPVILDVDLARLFGVPVRRIRRLVRARFENFPGDLCFSPECVGCDFGPTACTAFTEPGAWMLAALLEKEAPLLTTIALSRAFACSRQHGAGSHHDATGVAWHIASAQL